MQTVPPFVSFGAAADPERVRAGQVAWASSVHGEVGIKMIPITGQAHLSQPMEDFEAQTLGESAGG